MILKDYIKELISETSSNNNKIKIPKNIDLVLDAGAFNGGFQLGGLYYLKELEVANITKIQRISGASVGSILGLAYLLDKLDIMNIFCNNIILDYKKNYNLYSINHYFKDFLSMMQPNDYKKLNKKLYISYFNNSTKKQIIKSKYKSNKDLIKQIKKSCYIPFIANKKDSYCNGVDGAFPYIFKGDKPTLFLRLVSLEQAKTIMRIKNEQTVYGRIIDGIIDINNFFNKRKSKMCSFINDWSFYDFMIIRMREIIWILFLYFIECILILYKYLPQYVVESRIFKNILTFLKNVYIDFMHSTVC